MQKIVLTILLLCFSLTFWAQKSDANIIGHVTSGNEHLPYVNIQLKGTNLGTLTDESGHYQLIDLPPGNHIIIFSFVGYKPIEKTVFLVKNKTTELKINLEQDVLGLDEVVITGDRTLESRSESPVIVQSIGADKIETTQSTTLGESLNFSSGIRTETNCSNCGFSQVRMNGMEGPYSQILINNRAIFSGLAGVYGLEMIPTNMIEKIEVVKGGGSALYGGNAIAGTINLIMADPYMNSYEAGISGSQIGVGMDEQAYDQVINFNTTIVNKNYRTGLSLYGSNRTRDFWDANGDGYSELVSIENSTFGARFNQHIGKRSKVVIDFFNIKEKRRGGNKFDSQLHEADIAEALEHDITSAAITFDRHMRKNDLISIFASGQSVQRDSYYGANQSLKDYGKTLDFSGILGAQYKMLMKNGKLIAGVEYSINELDDTKLGYPVLSADSSSIQHTDNTVIVDQGKTTLGSYLQYELNISKFKIAVGARYDVYSIKDHQDIINDKEGKVFSPRVNVMYKLKKNLKLRASYSQGFRAPQIFDEDLHIEASGSRKVTHRNDPLLVAEKSNSYMASFDYYHKMKSSYFTVLLEGFYTQLNNPFANERTDLGNGEVIYTRTNSESGAVIQGINAEFGIYPSGNFKLNFGGTIQSSVYEEAQEFNEKMFFRTPNHYGFITMDYDITKEWCFSLSGSYTGAMLIPYHGHLIANPDTGELRESDDFFDLGVKIRYTFSAGSTKVQLFGGLKNILNSYQSDHEVGVDKDPSYIYGPAQPRTIYVGLKVGNLL